MGMMIAPLFVKRDSKFFVFALLLLLGVAGCASNPQTKTAKSKPTPTAKRDDAPLPDETLQSFAHYAAGLSFDMRDDSPEALEEYVKAAQLNPGEETLVLEVARRLLRNKETDRAIALLNKASSQPGSTGLVDSWLGLAYSAQGQTNKAIAANRTAIQKMPAQISAYANLCEIYLQSGKTNEVYAVLDEAARQKDAPPEFFLGLSEVILRMQAKDALAPTDAKKRALAALDKAAAANPDDPIQRQRLADAYLFRGEAAKAQTIFEKLFIEHPELPGVREKLISLYFRTNKAKAAAMLNDLRKDAPTDPRPHMMLGQLALDDQRLDEALEHFGTALQLNPADESLWYQVAALKIMTKKPADAVELLDKAGARFKPGFAQEFYKGLALASMDKYPEALSHLVNAELLAKTTEPDRLNAQFYFQLGSTSERAKDIEQAVKYFRHALELDPKFSEALNYLGYMWAERGENLDEARSMIERALKDEPKNAAFLDSMAWVLYRLKQPGDALPYMKKAIELTKEPDATLMDHLGDILAALNRKAEAREAWQKALKIEPKDEIRKKIESGS